MLLYNQLLLPFNKITKSGRMFDESSYDWNLIRQKINQYGVLYGELGQNNVMDVLMTNVSHIIRSVTIHKNVGLYGDIEILNTDKGKILKQMLIVGMPIYFRIKGTYNGSMNLPTKIIEIFTFNALTEDEEWFDKTAFRKEKIERIIERIVL